MTTRTITIHEEAIEKMMTYIAKVNRRAAKIDQTPITITETGREMVEQGDKTLACMVSFDIEGATPKINGWEFIGRIEHDDAIGNVLRVVPGNEIPLQYWDEKGECDHCNASRTRKDTFILRNGAGEYKQIGRQCIRDFIGYDNPADMYWWVGVADNISDMAKELNESVRVVPVFCVSEVLARVIACIREYGYVSRKMVDEHPDLYATSSMVSDTYANWGTSEVPAYVGVIIRAATAATEEATAILDWIMSWDITTQQQSEFNHNVYSIVSKDICRASGFGLVACLPVVHMKHMDQLKEHEARSNLHTGAIGDKLTVDITITNVLTFSGMYGISYLILMEDAAGNALVWKTSTFCHDYVPGYKATVKGTIKGHDEYKGRNQTVLTRCKMSSVGG